MSQHRGLRRSRRRVVIRVARTEDLAALAELHCRTVRVAYQHIFPASAPKPTPESVRPEWARFLHGPTEVQVSETSTEELVGTVVVAVEARRPNRGEITRLLVDPRVWGRGIGSGLLDHGIGLFASYGVSRVGLWVLAENHRARRFYEQHGWQLDASGTKETWPGIFEVRYERRVSPAPLKGHPLPALR